MPQNNQKKPTASHPAPKNAKSTGARGGTSRSGAKNAKSAPKSTPRSAAKSAPKTASRAAEPKRDPSLLRHQLMPYVLVLIAVFLVVCYLVASSTGFVGGFLKDFLFGLFSMAAWAIPPLLLNLAVFYKRDLISGSLSYKIVFSFICTSLISVLIHAFTRTQEAFSPAVLYTDGMAHIGGGVIGGLFGNLLLRGFGFAGTLILTIALILLFGIFLFGMTPHMFIISVTSALREWKNGLGESMAENRAQREAMQIEYEQRRQKQLEEARARAARQLSQQTVQSQDALLNAPGTRRPVSRRGRNVDVQLGDYPEDTAPETGVSVIPAAGDEPAIDPAVFDEVLRREQEKISRSAQSEAEAVVPAEEEAESDIVESDAPPFDMEDPVKPDNTPKLSFFRKDRVKPQPKTAEQELHELETDEIDLKKIFAESPDKGGEAIPMPSGELDDEEEADGTDAASLDLMIEKSRLNPTYPAPSAEDDEDEDDEPPFDVEVTSAPSRPIIEAVKPQQPKEYCFPPIPLLNLDTSRESADMSVEIQHTASKLVETLRSFNVKTKIINVSRGPTITRYELQPEIGTKVRSIMNLVDDIALHLATSGVRIEAPIPGKEAVGIEVPNKQSATVYIRELIEDPAFKNASSKLSTCLGMDVGGNPVYLDIAKMPHLLIAGTTGSGKSVCINSLILSILYKARPDEVKFIMIDPKKVELNVYNGIPHLLVPVVSDPKKAAGSLHWAVTEMERRYDLIEGAGVRNLKGYNNSIANDDTLEPLPQIVIIIDELADLMMMAKDDVEESICRIAQKARAAGIHLVIGTQRPSVNVITGLIKANVPSRIAFTTVSQIDSRTIIDVAGAEKLIGRGDMLFAPVGSVKPMRVQGAFVSDEEVEAVTTFIKQNYGIKDYDQSVMDTIEREAELCGSKPSTTLGDGDEEANDGDPMLRPAIQLAVESGKISTSLIQRRLQLGYGRAAKLIDAMQEMGIVGPPEGQKPRTVLISKQEYMEMELRRNG